MPGWGLGGSISAAIPAREAHTRKMPAHEMPAREMPAHEMPAHEIHPDEVSLTRSVTCSMVRPEIAALMFPQRYT
jgi:hypothetical protein